MEESESNEPQLQIPSPPATALPKEPSFSRWSVDEQHPVEPSSAAEEKEEPEGFDLPLLRSESESESPRSNEFRQRSGIGKGYAALDIGIGLRTSESMDKLDSLGNSSSSFSAVVVLRTLFFILVWYTFSTLLTLYNKTLLGDHLGKFPLPLMMNTVHFGMQAVLSNAIVCFQSRCCESSRGPTMTWKDYFMRVVPTALGTALDINLSNASLVFISVTFATMCKSASPIFLLVFAFAFRLESPSIKLLGIILVISVGVLLTVTKETQFEFWGFLFVMLAAVMSGFRWCMTQILLQVCYVLLLVTPFTISVGQNYLIDNIDLQTKKNYPCLPHLSCHFSFPLHVIFGCMKKESYGLRNPITLMSYVTPVMAVTTAIGSLVLDPWHNLSENKYFDSSTHIIWSCLLMLLGGALAFFMVLTEYILVSTTSAITVMVAGTVKEAVTILVAVFYFHDQFTLLKGAGLFTIMVGVGLFNWYKYQKLNKGHQSGNGEMNSTFNGAARYVILDEDILDTDT